MIDKGRDRPVTLEDFPGVDGAPGPRKLNIETIRYYERVEMLAPPPRTLAAVASTTRRTFVSWFSFDVRASWVSRLVKSAPFCAWAGLARLRVARSARSQRATSKTFGPN
jgi:hypothetical protein